MKRIYPFFYLFNFEKGLLSLNQTILLFLFLFFSPSIEASDNSYFVWNPFCTYRAGPGRSYNLGYESIAALLSIYNYPSQHCIFLDGELHRVDDGDLASSLGICLRSFVKKNGEMIGINLFHDFRHTHQADFNQIGLGCELLSPCWDLRINGYIPIGDKDGLINKTNYFYFDDLIVTKERVRVAMWGMDVEVGTSLINNCCFQMYGALGPYFYNSCCCNTLLGGMGRIALKFTNYFFFQCLVSYDPIFKTKIQGEITLSLFSPRIIENFKCLFRPIWRNRIIVLEDLYFWETNF
jgi:hypothetical protein